MTREVFLHATEDETGEEIEAMRQVFGFFEQLAGLVLSGDIADDPAKAKFGLSLTRFWSVAFHYLSPLNGADEFWNPLPNIALLARRWS